MSSYALVPIVLGVIGLLAALIVYRAVLSFPEGTGKVADIANQIHRGALVFMRREYIYLIIFVVVVSVIFETSLSFVMLRSGSPSISIIAMAVSLSDVISVPSSIIAAFPLNLDV